jgi:NlpC/P60 family putative phage cell wall peptidase
MSVTREAIVAEARTWLGVPWLHQGWRKETGCDCVGLIRGVGHALGLFDASDGNPAHARFIGYPREPDPPLMQAALALYFTPVGPGDVGPGDVLWLRFAGEPRHLAIFAEDHIIHALQSVGKVVEHRLDRCWAQRCVASWRFPGYCS